MEKITEKQKIYIERWLEETEKNLHRDYGFGYTKTVKDLTKEEATEIVIKSKQEISNMGFSDYKEYIKVVRDLRFNPEFIRLRKKYEKLVKDFEKLKDFVDDHKHELGRTSSITDTGIILKDCYDYMSDEDD